MDYKAQYFHPKWQEKRLKVLSLHNFKCQVCSDDQTQLHVHHPEYRNGAKVWEYGDNELMSLCEKCHEQAHGRRPASPTPDQLKPGLRDGASWPDFMAWLKNVRSPRLQCLLNELNVTDFCLDKDGTQIINGSMSARFYKFFDNELHDNFRDYIKLWGPNGLIFNLTSED